MAIPPLASAFRRSSTTFDLSPPVAVSTGQIQDEIEAASNQLFLESNKVVESTRKAFDQVNAHLDLVVASEIAEKLHQKIHHTHNQIASAHQSMLTSMNELTTFFQENLSAKTTTTANPQEGLPSRASSLTVEDLFSRLQTLKIVTSGLIEAHGLNLEPIVLPAAEEPEVEVQSL